MTSVPIVIKEGARPPRIIKNEVYKSYEKMTPDQLVQEWMLANKNAEFREAILKAMLEKGANPQKWITQRESEAGLYPNIGDPDFAARLYRKTEFSDLRSESVSDDICAAKQGFDTTPVQRLVARFLHPQMPYNGVLLDHGVGVGKTCSAITVAETFLDMMPHNRVTILCPQAIESGFRRTIFDPEKLKRLDQRDAKEHGELWDSKQCTGMTYLRLTNSANEPDLKEVTKAVEGAIHKRYRIMGYLAFANEIKNSFKAYESIKDDTIRKNREDALLYSMFSDHLIIVDEAHNLRDIDTMKALGIKVMEKESPVAHAAQDAAEGKKLTSTLKRILTVCEGMRLMLMTATPMYNSAPEILFLLNLLILNDTKDSNKLLEPKDYFENDGSLKAKTDGRLHKACASYISYMRGENPASFPLRLNPRGIAGEAFFKNTYPAVSILKKERKVNMSNHVIQILSNLPIVVHHADLNTPVGRSLYEHLKAKKVEEVQAVYDITKCSEKGKEFPFVKDEIMNALKMFGIKFTKKEGRPSLCAKITGPVLAYLLNPGAPVEAVAEEVEPAKAPTPPRIVPKKKDLPPQPNVDVEAHHDITICATTKPTSKEFPFSNKDIQLALLWNDIPAPTTLKTRKQLCDRIVEQSQDKVQAVLTSLARIEAQRLKPKIPETEAPPAMPPVPTEAIVVEADLQTKCKQGPNKLFKYKADQIKHVLKAHGIKVPKTAKREWLCDQISEEMLDELEAAPTKVRVRKPKVVAVESQSEGEEQSESEEQEEQEQEGGANDSDSQNGLDDSEISDAMLDTLMQISNITYPNKLSGTRGWDSNWDATDATRKQFRWQGSEGAKMDDVFSVAEFAKHSPKGAAILQSITSAKGICFTFSRYVKAGVLPLAVAMERSGWTRVMSDGSPFPLIRPSKDVPVVPRQCAFCIHKEGQTHNGHTFTPANYVLLTGDEGITPDFKGLLRYANTLTTESDQMGGKVKAILGSQIAAEGLDLKCIRENHLMDGWYHLNRIEQVVGRAVRYCSHAALPEKMRNCIVYMHTVSVPTYESADLYAYRLAARKAIPVGEIQRIIKIKAWDCLLNYNANVLSGLKNRKIEDAQGRDDYDKYDLYDKPYTSICDFQGTCNYTCAVNSGIAEADKNTSSYEASNARRKFLQKQQIVKRLFAEGIDADRADDADIAIPIEDLRKTVYGDMPWEIAAIGLREIINNPKFVVERKDGIRGNLILKSGYVLFQPVAVTNLNIPAALRYGRAYSQIPRTIVPSRGAIFQETVTKTHKQTTKNNTESSPDAAAAANSLETLLTAFFEWRQTVKRLKTAENLQEVPTPAMMEEKEMNAFRFIVSQFQQVPEVERVVEKWWLDNKLTYTERNALLQGYVSDELTDAEKSVARLFQPIELFYAKRGSGEPLKGFLTVTVIGEKKAETSIQCLIDGAPTKCPMDLYGKYIAAEVREPVSREKDTGEIFGTMSFGKKMEPRAVFKSVLKKDGMGGAQCYQTPNLDNPRKRVRTIYDEIRQLVPEDDPIHRALLESDPAKKPDKKRAAGARPNHVDVLGQSEICPYMEFLLRWMDERRLGGKRWFLSLAEAVRAI